MRRVPPLWINDRRPTSIIYTFEMELYHALNRGVDKRNIFDDDQDRARFVHDMFEFNDTRRAINSGRRIEPRIMNVGRRSSGRNTLVDIHGWCLMGNHYHLLLSERVDGGISEFLKKLNGGYAKYFNEKNTRVGALFQGKTKRILIDTDSHFLYILHYIHLNPLDFLKGSAHWREKGVSHANHALQHLEKYRWSSYLDYCGTKNFPSILTPDLFKDVFGRYRQSVQSYVRNMELSKVQNLLLE